MTDESAEFRLKYEPEYDLLSVSIGSSPSVENVEVEDGIYVRVDRAHHAVLGIEVLEARARFHKSADEIRSVAFVNTLLSSYGPRAFNERRPALSIR